MGIYDTLRKVQTKAPVTAKNPGEQFAAAGDQVYGNWQQAGADATQSRGTLLGLLTNGQGAFEQSARAAVDAAMPSFNAQLQGVRESALRRGVSNGELGTSYEGDLASAFQKNITNSIGQQALGLYNTQLGGAQSMYGMDVNRAQDSRDSYLDVLTGRRDWDAQNADVRRKKKGGLFGAIGGALGGIGGFLLGGPAGAAVGAKAGSGIGGALGSGGY